MELTSTSADSLVLTANICVNVAERRIISAAWIARERTTRTRVCQEQPNFRGIHPIQPTAAKIATYNTSAGAEKDRKNNYKKGAEGAEELVVVGEGEKVG
jgi:hypothetical protein